MYWMTTRQSPTTSSMWHIWIAIQITQLYNLYNKLAPLQFSNKRSHPNTGDILNLPNLKLKLPLLLCHNWLQVAQNLRHVKSHGRDKSNDRNWHTKPTLRFPVGRRSVSHYRTQCIMRCRRSEAFPTYLGRTTVPGSQPRPWNFGLIAKAQEWKEKRRERSEGKGNRESREEGCHLDCWQGVLVHVRRIPGTSPNSGKFGHESYTVFHSLGVTHKKTCIRPT